MTGTVRVELPGRLPLSLRIAVRVNGEPAAPGDPVAVPAGRATVVLGLAGSVGGRDFAGRAELPLEAPEGATVRVTPPGPTG